MTPDGLKRDADVAPGSSIAPQTAQRMNRMIIAVLLLALCYFAFDKFVLAPHRPAPVATVAASATLVAPAPVISEKSIAVLAFTDLSPEHDQEYFSDGIAEEILDALAQLRDLKVAGRTSSFYFKGKEKTVQEIGQALGVAHVLEGSVRKQGDKVRITAQLIQTKDGFHVWSESFDGDLKDVFALQEKIARSITDKLQVVLSGAQSQRLVNAGTENTEAYALYLQATSIFNRRDGENFPAAIAALENAIRLDPNYARAHSRLAALYAIVPSYTDANVVEAHEKLMAHARRASELDPNLAEPYAAAGFSWGKFPGKLIEQRDTLERALAMDPNDVTSNFWLGLALAETGYPTRGAQLVDHALSVDPMLPNALRWRGLMYFYAGDAARAEPMMRRARDLGLLPAESTLSKLVAARGDTAAAAKLWADGSRTVFSDMPADKRLIIGRGIYGDQAARKPALDLLEAYLAQPRDHVALVVPESLYRLGETERALEVQRTRQITDTTDFLALMWTPPGRGLRQSPGFARFLQDYGFPALWDKYGAPDLCRKRGPNDYVCE
jgi:TolB-like protein